MREGRFLKEVAKLFRGIGQGLWEGGKNCIRAVKRPHATVNGRSIRSKRPTLGQTAAPRKWGMNKALQGILIQAQLGKKERGSSRKISGGKTRSTFPWVVGGVPARIQPKKSKHPAEGRYFKYRGEEQRNRPLSRKVVGLLGRRGVETVEACKRYTVWGSQPLKKKMRVIGL